MEADLEARVRQNGQRYFARRRERRWYAADVLERPAAPFHNWPKRDLPPSLPAEFPTWAQFWERMAKSDLSELTDMPVPATAPIP